MTGTKARIGGYCHLNLGEEATVTGLMAALRQDEDQLRQARQQQQHNGAAPAAEQEQETAPAAEA